MHSFGEGKGRECGDGDGRKARDVGLRFRSPDAKDASKRAARRSRGKQEGQRV